MDIREKLERLRAIDDVALVRWTGGMRVNGGKFIPATELRMNILACDRGRVYFSIAASVMHTINGRAQLRWFDEGVCRIMSGGRKNINVLKSFLHRNEEFTPVTQCFHVEVDENCDRFVEKRTLGMGTAMWYPEWHVPVPDFYRLTARPETLRPVYTKEMLELIGGSRDDSPEDLHRLFLDNIDRFGERTAEGWMVRDELVAMGGMCCCAAEGITKSYGSRVFKVPLKLLKMDIAARKWGIHLGGDNEVETIPSDSGADA